MKWQPTSAYSQQVVHSISIVKLTSKTEVEQIVADAAAESNAVSEMHAVPQLTDRLLRLRHEREFC